MSDTMREAFDEIMGDFSMPPDDSADYDEWVFTKAWQAAQADARALVEKLEKAIRHLDDSVYFWSGYAPKHIKEDKGQEYEEDRAVAQSALTKAQAFMEGKQYAAYTSQNKRPHAEQHKLCRITMP